MNVYICLNCKGPVIFRYPWHQIYHLGTGWRCWDKAGDGKPSLSSFDFPTPAEEREADLKRFRKIFRTAKSSSDVQPPFRFIGEMWKHRKPDMIHDVLDFLVDQGSEFADDLIDRIGRSRDWDRYATLRKKHPILRGERRGSGSR